MSLSVTQYPIGHKIATTGFQCTVNSLSGRAQFSKTNPVGAHGLVNGDYVYIVSNVDDYFGFWRVDRIDNNNFRIQVNGSTQFAPFMQADTVTVYKALLEHGYSAIHEPIIYKLVSDAWPSNSLDTARTVSSVTNDNGYCNLNLSGDIKATGSAHELEWVQVTGANEGIYQIINWVSDSDITINMPYTTGVSFSGSLVEYYYNNYHGVIRLYAGLTSAHTWASVKPYSLILEKNEVPDSDGIITININSYLKSAIEVLTNNALLGTLPNDIDSFCYFYITFAEAYDYSPDGYTLQTLEGSFTDTSGSLEGIAVNADLPFKNTYSGYMSDYLYAIYSDPMKFLTSFASPVIWSGQWWEISWLNQYGTTVGFQVQRYLSGVLLSTTRTNVLSYGIGVYHQRVQVTGSEDRIDVSVIYPFPGSYRVISEVKTITVDTSCNDQNLDLQWKNPYGGKDQWRFTLGKTHGVNVYDVRTQTKNTFQNWEKSWGASADTVKHQTRRKSNKTYVLRTQDVTAEQVIDLQELLTSPLVQIVNSNSDRRTLLVEDGEFTVLEELNKQNSISFRVSFTDDLPAQSL